MNSLISTFYFLINGNSDMSYINFYLISKIGCVGNISHFKKILRQLSQYRLLTYYQIVERNLQQVRRPSIFISCVNRCPSRIFAAFHRSNNEWTDSTNNIYDAAVYILQQPSDSHELSNLSHFWYFHSIECLLSIILPSGIAVHTIKIHQRSFY